MASPFDPRKFFYVAIELLQGGHSEVRLRLAVGRAYYACFLVARDWAHIKDYDRVHTEVIETLQEHHPELGVALAILRSYRVVADYQMLPVRRQFRDWEQNWKYVRGQAEDLLEKLDKLAPLRIDRK